MISALSPREKLVARLIRKGMSNRDIAQRMGVAVGTVKIHVHHILNKTNKRSRLELAVDRRLLRPGDNRKRSRRLQRGLRRGAADRL
jgi:DNA-binding NarL/FixJ family response regulator